MVKRKIQNGIGEEVSAMVKNFYPLLSHAYLKSLQMTSRM
jgi:hypothetical protein